MKNLKGKKFGHLTVIDFYKIVKDSKNRYFWVCKCQCGKEVIKRNDYFINNNDANCGCMTNTLKAKFFNENNPKKTHGKSKTRLYKIYTKIKERCYSKNYVEYYLYGGRGINICKEWLSDFMKFYNWSIENGYNEKLSIDRIDVNEGYSPLNCKWATNIEQANNKRNNIVITHDGVSKTLPQWCREYNVNYGTAKSRYERNFPFEKIFSDCDFRYDNTEVKHLTTQGKCSP